MLLSTMLNPSNHLPSVQSSYSSPNPSLSSLTWCHDDLPQLIEIVYFDTHNKEVIGQGGNFLQFFLIERFSRAEKVSFQIAIYNSRMPQRDRKPEQHNPKAMKHFSKASYSSQV